MVLSAWLPHYYFPVISLEQKKIIRNIDFISRKPVHLEQGACIFSMCYTYKICYDVFQTISVLNIASSCQWKEVMHDPSFNDFL